MGNAAAVTMAPVGRRRSGDIGKMGGRAVSRLRRFSPVGHLGGTQVPRSRRTAAEADGTIGKSGVSEGHSQNAGSLIPVRKFYSSIPRQVWLKARLSQLLAFIPDVQEVLVAGGGNIASRLPSCAIQRRPYLLLALSQFGQWHLEGDTILYPVEIGENLGHNRFVLSIPALRNIRQRHFREVHRNVLGPGSHKQRSLKRNLKLT